MADAQHVRAEQSARDYKGPVLALAPPGAWLVAALTGRYEDASLWLGWAEGHTDTARWILFVDREGHGLFWPERAADGAVVGCPYELERTDLLGRPSTGTPRADTRHARFDIDSLRSLGCPTSRADTRHARFDIGTLRSPERQANGWLRVDGHLTRTGIFDYRNDDGSLRREYRPAAEVFRADSLRTFSMVPVTNDHPPSLLDASNAKQFSVGSVGETVRQDGDFVSGSMMITDSETIRAIESGKAELSCGYECDMDETPGVFDGQRYDAVQRNIRGNHVAIVDRGRAKGARLRLDRGDAEMIPDARADNSTGEKHMKILINGVEVEVADTTGQLILAERKDAADKLAAQVKEADKASARADAAEDKASKAEKARNDAADPARFDARVNDRVGVLLIARSVLGGVVKLDGKSDRDIRVAVLSKLLPDVKLDGKSDVYVEARFDAAVEEEDKKNPGLAKARKIAAGEEDDDEEDKDGKKTKKDAADPEDAARQRMLESNRKAHERK